MVELGNWNYYYDRNLNNPEWLAEQQNSKIKYDMWWHWGAWEFQRSGVQVLYEQRVSPVNTMKDMTDFIFIQNMMNEAISRKSLYNYAAFLLSEELTSPIITALWQPVERGMSTWHIEGTFILGGVLLELIKTWALRVKGTWDSVWWTAASTANNTNDPLVREWNWYYQERIYRGWNQFIKGLGKKTAVIGLVGNKHGSSLMQEFRGEYHNYQYILDSYDMLITYRYPSVLGWGTLGTTTDWRTETIGVNWSVLDLQELKSLYKGKTATILTAKWPDGNGTLDQSIAKAEFMAVAPYADIIFFTPYMDIKNLLIPYVPVIISFLDNYNSQCPQSQCDFTISTI